MAETKTIKLPCYNITVKVLDEGFGTYGTIKSDLTDGEGTDSNAPDPHEVALETLERFILSAACSGIDIETPAFLEAIETVVDAVGNRYGE